MDWTFPASGPLKADLELAAGIVEVELSATDDVRVQLEPLERDNEAVRDLIANASVSCQGSRLEVRVPKRRLRDFSLRLRVLVPPASSTRIRTASADVVCSGPVGTFDARTSSGDVTVKDTCDTAMISTASGDIRLAEVLGEVELQTASGDVVTRSIGGRASVTTASGDVRVTSVGHDCRLRSASGDVAVGCAYEGDLSVNTASGDVRIGVGAGVGTWLDLITVSGDSQCTLAAEGQGEGEADLRITCRTVSGDILVHSGESAAGDRVSAGSGGAGGAGGVGGASIGDLGTDEPIQGTLDPPRLPGSAFAPGDPFADQGDPPCAAAFGADSPGFGSDENPGEPGHAAGFPGMSGLAKWADLADLAGLGDVADLMMGWPTTGRGLRLPWRRP
ncbi:MAG TPA: DUF4097 family beta strand repeat-containing protein [Acidimicrobiales bacterium]|nr:DUF4097 family beta strand repeat-containing protein [Acidimicrobiales bacterium]